MKTKIFKHAALSAVIIAGMSFGGMKAYDYSYARRVNSDDAMLQANVEALSQIEAEMGKKPTPSQTPCLLYEGDSLVVGHLSECKEKASINKPCVEGVCMH